MKTLSLTKLFIPAAALVLATSVFAGPVAAEKSVAPVAPVPECNWTGFYIGINGGVGWQESRFTNNWSAGYESYYFGGASTTTWDNVNYQVGGQVGYNYQFQDLVVGIEADADYSGNTINKSRSYIDSGDTTRENWHWNDYAKIDFQGSVRGRLGISVLENKGLIYVTGGGAFVHGDWREDSHYFTSDESGYYDYNWKGDDWRWGLIGGAGIEYKFNCRWSVKGEALYTWLAEDTQGPSFVGGYFDYSNAPFTFADELFSARFGINYHFGGFFGH